MLRINDNRIVIAQTSIALPNDLFLDGKSSGKDKLVFVSEDRSYSITFNQIRGIFPTVNQIKKKYMKRYYKIMDSLTEININGLIGYCFAYREIFFDNYKAIIKNKKFNSEYLILHISVKKKKYHISELMNRKEMVSIFCDIRAI